METSAYLFSSTGSIRNPTLSVVAGTTVMFNLQGLEGYPLYFNTSAIIDSNNSGLTAGLGHTNGTLKWVVPNINSSVLYYCGTHSRRMKGVIMIIGAWNATGRDPIPAIPPISIIDITASFDYNFTASGVYQELRVITDDDTAQHAAAVGAASKYSQTPTANLSVILDYTSHDLDVILDIVVISTVLRSPAFVIPPWMMPYKSSLRNYSTRLVNISAHKWADFGTEGTTTVVLSPPEFYSGVMIFSFTFADISALSQNLTSSTSPFVVYNYFPYVNNPPVALDTSVILSEQYSSIGVAGHLLYYDTESPHSNLTVNLTGAAGLYNSSIPNTTFAITKLCGRVELIPFNATVLASSKMFVLPIENITGNETIFFYYPPSGGLTGKSDSFSFVIHDGHMVSALATVVIGGPANSESVPIGLIVGVVVGVFVVIAAIAVVLYRKFRAKVTFHHSVIKIS